MKNKIPVDIKKWLTNKGVGGLNYLAAKCGNYFYKELKSLTVIWPPKFYPWSKSHSHEIK